MSALAVLTASVVGSLHCASMCGGFCTAVTTGTPSRTLAQILYHLGRFLGYSGLALAAGAVGSGLRGAGDLAGWHNATGVAMGLVLIVMAARALVGDRKRRRAHLVQLGSKPKASRVQRLLASALRRGGLAGALGIGLGSAVLPCGWLWGYVAVAAATGTVGGSLLIMTAFWLGTLPALVSVGFAASWLGRRLGPYAPRITALVLLGLGGLALAGKLTPVHATDETPPCHAR